MPEIWSPNIEIVDALQYRRNTRSRSSTGTMSALPGPEVVREGQVQPGDQARSRRPQFGPDLALEVFIDQLAYPAAQLLEFLRGDVQDPVAELDRLLPLGRLVRAGLQPAHQLLEVLFRDHR